MVKNQWYAVMDSKELKFGKPVGATRFSQKLVFWRTEENHVVCMFDKCCHRGAAISAGEIVNGHAICPFHGFEYDITGKVVVIPANGKNHPVPDHFKVNTYPAKDAYGYIWVWYGEDREYFPRIPYFEELAEGFCYSSFSEIWNVHYSRAIENQLDVVHLPFVHRNTIGRGNKTLVNGPVVKWKDDRMTFYVMNEQDVGQIPLSGDEIKEYEKLFSLQFQFPNIWQNRISDKMRITAAFVPIDETNTRIYIRLYQRFCTVPVLWQLMGIAGNAMNRVILHQDRRVVLTQQPKRSDLFMDENLVAGDMPIIQYRERREELKKQS